MQWASVRHFRALLTFVVCAPSRAANPAAPPIHRPESCALFDSGSPSEKQGHSSKLWWKGLADLGALQTPRPSRQSPCGPVCAQPLVHFASRIEGDPRQRVNLPYGRHVGSQRRGPGPASLRMTHIEEQRPFQLERNGRVVEIVRCVRKLCAEELLERISCRFQLREGFASLRRKT